MPKLHPTNPTLIKDENVPREKGQTRVLADGSLLYLEPITEKEVPAVRLEDIRGRLVEEAKKKKSYRFPKKRGFEDTNVTAFVKKDYNYGSKRENWPDWLFQIQSDHDKGEKPEGYVMDNGHVVLDAFDHGLRNFGHDLPMYVSSELEGQDIEDYLRRNREISVYDLVARAPNGYYVGPPKAKATKSNKKTKKEEEPRDWHEGPPRVGTFSMRATRFRLRAGCLSWDKKDGTVAKNQRILDIIPQRYKDPAVNSTKGWRDLNKNEIKQIQSGAKRKPQQGPKSKRAAQAAKDHAEKDGDGNEDPIEGSVEVEGSSNGEEAAEHENERNNVWETPSVADATSMNTGYNSSGVGFVGSFKRSGSEVNALSEEAGILQRHKRTNVTTDVQGHYHRRQRPMIHPYAPSPSFAHTEIKTNPLNEHDNRPWPEYSQGNFEPSVPAPQTYQAHLQSNNPWQAPNFVDQDDAPVSIGYEPRTPGSMKARKRSSDTLGDELEDVHNYQKNKRMRPAESSQIRTSRMPRQKKQPHAPKKDTAEGSQSTPIYPETSDILYGQNIYSSAIGGISDAPSPAFHEPYSQDAGWNAPSLMTGSYNGGPQYESVPQSSHQVKARATHRSPLYQDQNTLTSTPMAAQYSMPPAHSLEQRYSEQIFPSPNLNSKRKWQQDVSNEQPIQQRPIKRTKKSTANQVLAAEFQNTSPLMIGPTSTTPMQGNGTHTPYYGQLDAQGNPFLQTGMALPENPFSNDGSFYGDAWDPQYTDTALGMSNFGSLNQPPQDGFRQGVYPPAHFGVLPAHLGGWHTGPAEDTGP